MVALILGKLGRTGPLAWHMPLPANLTLRTFGLTLFLAAVGLGSGAPFVETLAANGTAVPCDRDGDRCWWRCWSGSWWGSSCSGWRPTICSASSPAITGNPAILVYANKVQPSDRIDAAYATVFPSLTILKILCAQIALALL